MGLGDARGRGAILLAVGEEASEEEWTMVLEHDGGDPTPSAVGRARCLREAPGQQKELAEFDSEADWGRSRGHSVPRPQMIHVRMLLLSFMFMFQGYGAMVGVPQYALKRMLNVSAEQAGDFQDATAAFQLAKLLMRIAQIVFLIFVQANGIVYLSYVLMFCAVCVPMVFVWGFGVTGLWAIYLKYILGGIAVGLFEGTFLSVISSLGKDVKTFVIMGAPLGFAMHNIVLGTFSQLGMPVLFYYVYTALCLPMGAMFFYLKAPVQDPKASGKGCSAFMNSARQVHIWAPRMFPLFVAKFIGNFVLEDGFPLLFNTFNTNYVPIFGGPESVTNLIPFAYYTAWIWFPCMAVGDTVSRRVPNFLTIGSKESMALYLGGAIILCVAGEAMTFLLVPIVTALAALISNFGNGFIYGLSAKFIDSYIPEEHRYTAYNFWCLCGDLGGYAGQSRLSVELARKACAGRNYAYVCHHNLAMTSAAP